jgi:pyruvate formate lyase activating enzyme
LKEAFFYTRESDNKVRCRLCAHTCLIKPGRTGKCGVRKNSGGTLHSLVYGRVISAHVDPIEKKPLFHLAPGSLSFSVATVGCNFTCKHCQNADISQMPRDHHVIQGHDLSPEQAVTMARESSCRSIAYTYTEPTIYFEYAFDTARLASEAGLMNVFVTNGYTSAEALRHIAPYLDGANVDLKAFTEKFYRKICGARLAPVLDTLKLYRELGIWLEVTTLLIPGENDSDGELRDIAGFIGKELGPEVPWHVSAFHPTYHLTDHPRTPAETLRRAREIGLAAGLRYVYEGNIPGEGEDTACPGCSRPVITRFGFKVRENLLRDGCCPACGTAVDGRWEGGDREAG